MAFLLLEQVERFKKVFDFVSPGSTVLALLVAHPRILAWA